MIDRVEKSQEIYEKAPRSTWLIGLQNYIANPENSLVVSDKGKHTLTI